MKYLSLFEAFESDVISKTVKFIKNKIGKKESKKFTESLNRIQRYLDFPINKISDNDIEYLTTKRAIKIKNKKEVQNRSGIYCIKFWFSLDHGYLGFTGVGNQRYDKTEQNGFFNKDQINHIKNTFGITTGRLKRVNRNNHEYSMLNHGDDVVAVLCSDQNDIRRLTKGKIFKDGYRLFFIHNNEYSSGGQPEYYDVTRDEAGDWTDWGRYSWSMGYASNIGGDHSCLHKYIPGDNDLLVDGDDQEEEEVETFNLPFNDRLNIRNWSYYQEDDWSMNQYYNEQEPKFGWEKLKMADFAVVLYMDRILELEKPSDIVKKRGESKSGATKLMTDEQIKNTNIERYMSGIVSKMGISETGVDFKNLQKIISQILCGDYSLFVITSNKPSISNVDTISSNLLSLLYRYNDLKLDNDESRDMSSQEIEYLKSSLRNSFNSFFSRYRSYTADSKIYKNNYDKNYNELLKKLNENTNVELTQIDNIIRDFFEKYKEIGKYINNYIIKQNVNSIEDYTMIYVKISSIRQLLGNDLFRFNSEINSFISDMSYSDGEISHHLRYLREDIDEMEWNFKRLLKVESYIKSILS